jgi:hypothetical protein
MTTSPGSPPSDDVEGAPVPPPDDRESPLEDDEMMQGGEAGQLRGGHGRGRGHGRDDGDDDEDESGRRNVGG